MKIPFNKKINFPVIMCTIMIIIASILGFLCLSGEINIGDEGEKMDPEIQGFLVLFCGIIAISNAVCLINILRLRLKKGAFIVDSEGIKDTFVFSKIFTIFIVFPVKFIPWDAMSDYEVSDEGVLHSDIKKEKIPMIVCSSAAKFILKIQGFNFGYGFADIPIKDIKKLVKIYTSQKI